MTIENEIRRIAREEAIAVIAEWAKEMPACGHNEKPPASVTAKTRGEEVAEKIVWKEACGEGYKVCLRCVDGEIFNLGENSKFDRSNDKAESHFLALSGAIAAAVNTERADAFTAGVCHWASDYSKRLHDAESEIARLKAERDTARAEAIEQAANVLMSHGWNDAAAEIRELTKERAKAAT